MSEDPAVNSPVRPRTSATDEVLRRVGRNLVILQQIEAVLKVLVSGSDLEFADLAHLPEVLEARQSAVDRQTMGGLSNSLMGNVVPPGDEVHSDTDPTRWRIRHTLVVDDMTRATLEHQFRCVVELRNELVHAFLPRWQKAAAGQADEVLSWLDEQRQGAVAALTLLRGWCNDAATTLSDTFEFLASEDGQRWLANPDLEALRASRLVRLLGEFSQTSARPDGWADLSDAGNFIAQTAPESRDEVLEQHGLRRLQAVLRATQLFDILEEPSPAGPMKTLYRVKAGWSLLAQAAAPPSATVLQVNLARIG